MTSTLSERELQAQVVEVARLYGYLVYHTHDSRRSAPGFPDLVLAHPDTGAVVFAELKTATGRMSPAQFAWLHALADGTHASFLWRPEHLADGTIPSTLARLSGRGRSS